MGMSLHKVLHICFDFMFTKSVWYAFSRHKRLLFLVCGFGREVSFVSFWFSKLSWITDAPIATLYCQPSDEYFAVHRAGGVLVVLGYTTEIFHRRLWSFLFADREVGFATTKEDDDKGVTHLGTNSVTTSHSKHIDWRPSILPGVYSQ